MGFGWRSQIALPRLLAACLVLGSSNLASAEGPAVSPVSVIQIPLELDLRPLVQAADSSLPTQAGHWPGWHKWHGIDTRYRAWRGPPWLAMQGGVLSGPSPCALPAPGTKGADSQSVLRSHSRAYRNGGKQLGGGTHQGVARRPHDYVGDGSCANTSEACLRPTSRDSPNRYRYRNRNIPREIRLRFRSRSRFRAGGKMLHCKNLTHLQRFHALKES
jgi:hypothetical protein